MSCSMTLGSTAPIPCWAPPISAWVMRIGLAAGDLRHADQRLGDAGGRPWNDSSVTR